MLKPLKPAKEIRSDFATLDIENKPDGEMFWVCVCHNENGSKRFKHYDNWDDALDYLVMHGLTRVYAHNGGGWDWLSLLEKELANGKDSVEATMNGSRMVMMRLVRDEMVITLLDSFCLFYSGLDSVAKNLLGKSKREMPYENHHQFYLEDTAKFVDYAETDAGLLFDCVETLGSMLFDNIAPIDSLGITLASTAMKVFRAGFQREPITVPTDKKLKDFLREGYRGGRVEVFKPGYFPNVTVYDANSLYPTVMKRTPVPVSYNGYWTKIYSPKLQGCYRVNFKCAAGAKFGLMVDGVNATSGSGVYYSPELEWLKENGGTFTVIEGYVFFDSQIIFAEYVDTLYKLRQQYKGEAMDFVAKLLLNSLYGKFGQKPERERICRMDADEMLERLQGDGKAVLVDPIRNIWSVKEDCEIPYESVAIAGLITSASRVALISKCNLNTVYVDTDSIHSTTPRPDLDIGTNLGQWKKEYCGEGAYAGKKLYALRDEKTEKVRVKGVKVGGKFGSNVSFDDIARLASNPEKTLRCDYKSATTSREAFKGKKVCVFNKKHRTIKRTV